MKLTIEEIIEEYFRYSKMKLKKTTFEEQKRKIKKYIVPYFKERNIYEIDIRDIISWKEYIEKNNFSYNYESYLYYSLCNLFDYLIKFYNIKCNYARIDGNFLNREPKKKGNFWHIEDYNKFINVIDNKKDKILFKLLFFTGFRKSEILALKWCDIDFKNNTIDINKGITRNHEFISTKTESSNRIISLSKNIINELQNLKEKSNNNDLIFDKGYSFTSVKRKKDYYCKLSGVKQIKIHEFRHSHSIYLYLNNIPVDEIQHRLGHSNMSTTTDVYLRYLPRNEKRVIKLLNSVC